MPIDTLEIHDGPPFKKFLFLSMIATNHGWFLEFTFSSPDRGKHKQSITINSIGQFPAGKDFDEDIFSFIGSRQGCGREKWAYFFYVGQYNVRTRKGVCECYNNKHFINSNVAGSLCKTRQFPS